MKIEFFVFSKKVESWQEAVNASEEVPKKPNLVMTRFTQFVNQGLVDELRNSKIFPMEAVEDRKKGVCQKSCVLALCITCN